MTKILCIDDTPEQMLDSGLSLEETINNIFKDTHYKLIYKKTGEEGIKTAIDSADDKINIPNDKYILQSDFEKYKKEIESRLAAIEHTLSLKSSKKK